MCSSLPKNVQIPIYQTAVDQTFLTSAEEIETEKYIDPHDEKAKLHAKQGKFKKYLKQTQVFTIGGEFELIQKGVFVPPLDLLVALSA